MAKNNVENIRANVYINEKQAGGSLRSLEGQARKVRNELMGMSRDAEGFGAKKAEFQKINGELRKQKAEIYGVKQGWNNASISLQKYLGLMVAFSGGVLGMIYSLREMVNQYTAFESGLTNVFTLLDDDTFQRYHKELERGSKQIMRDYGLAQEDVTKALFDAISAGVPAGQAIEFLNTAATLAVGGVTKLSVATDGMTSILNAWKLEIGDSKEVADAFFAAQKEGKTTVEELSSSIGKVAPIASAANISYKETLSMLAALTKGGISTRESVTYLRGAIQSLIKPGEDAKKTLEKYNVPMGIAQVRAVGFGEALKRLNAAAADNPDIMADAIGSVEGLQAVLALSGKGLAEYDRILQMVMADTGEHSALTKAFNRQQETGAQYMARARQEITLTHIEIGEKLQPIVGELMFTWAGMMKLLAATPKFLKDNKELIILLAGAYVVYNQALITATLAKWRQMAAEKAGVIQSKLSAFWMNAQITAQGIYITSTNLLTGRITAATAAQRMWNLVFMANPLVAVTAGIMLLVGALKLYDNYSTRSIELDKQNKAIKKELKEANEQVKEAQEELNVLTKAYIDAAPDEREAIRKLIGFKQEEIKARLANIKAKREEIAETASELTGGQKLKALFLEYLTIGGKSAANMERLKDSLSNSAEATGEYDSAILDLENSLKEMGDSMTRLDEIDAETKKAQLDRIKELSEAEKKARQDAEEELQKFLQSLKDSELTKVQQHYKAALQLLEKFYSDEAKLTEAQAKLRQEIEDRYKQALRIEGLEEDQAARENEVKRQQDLMENSLQQLSDTEKAHILENFDLRTGTQEELNNLLYDAELAHLERMLEARRLLGQETIDIEEEITQMKLNHYSKREEADRRASIDQAYNSGYAASSQITNALLSSKAQMEAAEKTAEKQREEAKKQELTSEQLAAKQKQIDMELMARQKEIAEEKKRAILNAIKDQIAGYIAEAIAKIVSEQIISQGWVGIATGAAAGAAAAALFAAIIPSYHTGGFTDSGMGTGLGIPDPKVPGRKIKGVVHDNEYVVATEELKRPDIAGMVNYIEGARMARMGGFANGGYTSGGTVVNNNSTQTINMGSLEVMLERLLARMDQPSIAIIPDGTRKVINDRNELEKVVREQSIMNG